jgi:DNA ligase-1
MLSAKVDDPAKLPYPLLASPKLDGIRALVRDGVVVSRNLKPIPNAYVQSLYGGAHMEGLDGELIVGLPFGHDVWNRSQSGVMSEDGKPDVWFHIFDHWKEPGGYGPRMAQIRRMRSDGRWPHGCAVMVPQHKVFNARELLEFEEEQIGLGYEGVMLRKLAADTPYKHGRSTLREAYLMKLVRRHTCEGVVVDVVEQMHNANEMTRDARGYAKRSKAKAGLVGTGKVGALVLAGPNVGRFEVGTGFTDQQRTALWRDRKSLTGKVVTVEYRELTPDGLPRFPVFKGFRDPRDMG